MEFLSHKLLRQSLLLKIFTCSIVASPFMATFRTTKNKVLESFFPKRLVLSWKCTINWVLQLTLVNSWKKYPFLLTRFFDSFFYDYWHIFTDFFTDFFVFIFFFKIRTPFWRVFLTDFFHWKIRETLFTFKPFILTRFFIENSSCFSYNSRRHLVVIFSRKLS